MYDNDDKPPLFPSWNVWYVLVVLVLAVLILFFYYLTKKFS
ncbi:hypothetical protein [Niabella aquatica]